MKDGRIRWDGKRLKVGVGMLFYQALCDGTIITGQIIHVCEDGVTVRMVNEREEARLDAYAYRYLTSYSARTKKHALRKRIADDMRDVKDYTKSARFHANRARKLRKLLATTED